MILFGEVTPMRSLAKCTLTLMAGMLLVSCVAEGPRVEDNNDRLPMYGGGDRRADPELRAADDKLIAELIQRYGSPRAAAQNSVERGNRYFRLGDYAGAMRNFNQAWLLDPNRPDPFWGFARVFDDQGESCKARAMIDRALDLNLSKPAALADAGRIYTYCAVSDETLSAADKRRYFERSEELYFRAVSMAPTDPALFGSWAMAHYWQGNYADAWKMIEKQRALGGVPGNLFLGLLQAKMPEP
jgi:Flp pilus assembly protein TadD